MTPQQLLERCQAIELECGRDRNVERETGNRDRTLDCDIIFYGDVSLNEVGLILPYPRWAERAFVLLPLMDLRNDLTEAQQGLLDNAIDAFDLDPTSCRRVQNVLDLDW